MYVISPLKTESKKRSEKILYFFVCFAFKFVFVIFFLHVCFMLLTFLVHSYIHSQYAKQSLSTNTHFCPKFFCFLYLSTHSCLKCHIVSFFISTLQNNFGRVLFITLQRHFNLYLYLSYFFYIE